jgi:hypothetical protein
MTILSLEIHAISNMALEVMKRVLAENEKSQKLTEDGLGPLSLASALSDFFQISDALENGGQSLDDEQRDEFGDYGLDLLDRLAYQLRQLEIHDQRDSMSRIYASLAVWLARRETTLNNLEGIADSFAWLVNGLSETDELADICMMMDEVLDAASAELLRDEDKSNAWRPWRVLNLNTGIAATRSLNPELMESIFNKLERRLPHDLPGFFADGKSQMMTQNVPDEVSDVMKRYADKWPRSASH